MAREKIGRGEVENREKRREIVYDRREEDRGKRQRRTRCSGKESKRKSSMKRYYREESSESSSNYAQKSLHKFAAEKSARENGHGEKEQGSRGGGPATPEGERIRSYENKGERRVKRGINEGVDGS